MWSATQIPHIMRFLLAATTGVPESKIRVIAPDVGGGFGGKLQTTPEEWITWAVARRIGKPCKYTETRSESLIVGPPRPRPVAEADAGRHQGRHGHRPQGRPARRPRRLRRRRRRRCADPRRVHVQRDLQVPRLPVQLHDVLTNKTWTDAYRGAGRPEATFAIERMMDELAAEVGVDPLEIREKNWIKHEEFPFTTVAGLELRLRQLRGGHREGQGDVRVRRAARRAEAASRRPATRSSSASASRRSPRCAASPRQPGARRARLRRRRLGARTDPDAPDRQGRGDHRRLARTARATRPPGQPDRRRPARGPVRGRRGAARRHPGLAQGYGHLRLALAGRRAARRWSARRTR